MFLEKLAGLLAGFLFKIYSSTFRYHVSFEDPGDRKLFFSSLNDHSESKTNNLIFACFHQDDMSCLPFFSYHNICILISRSKDGQILSSATEFLGYQTVRGSSHRGAVAGLLAAMKKVMEGQHFTIAVDGPRGPLFKVKDGITAIAQKSGRPIVPVRAKPKWKYVFKDSWNQATLPLPGSRIEIRIGKINQYQTLELEKKLKSL